MVRGGARKTHVMYQANLSFALLKRYLAELLDAGLVRCDNDRYDLTRRGQSYLERYGEYSKRCERVEQELNHVSDEKTVLENLLGSESSKRSNVRLQNKKVT